MLPREIDLTERRDFMGRGSVITEIPRNEFLERVNNFGNMTSEEYDALIWWEGIFGKREHRSAYWRVFGETEEQYDEKWRNRCPRCGKKLPFPWMRSMDLCHECSEDLYAEIGGRIPWKTQYKEVAFSNDMNTDTPVGANRGAMEVFSMR